jgi:hypothetical protein
MSVFLSIDILITLGLAGGVAYLIVHRRTNDTQRTLREHARLTALAAKASRKGDTGEANVYIEAADRLMKNQPTKPTRTTQRY